MTPTKRSLGKPCSLSFAIHLTRPDAEDSDVYRRPGRHPPHTPAPVSPHLSTPSTCSSNRSNLSLSASGSSASNNSSSPPTSSPLAPYILDTSLAHLPSGSRLLAEKLRKSKTPHPPKPLSRELQAISKSLRYLISTCAFCWALGLPRPASHRLAGCPILAHPTSNVRAAYEAFRNGIQVSRACYGCYTPKVRYTQTMIVALGTLPSASYNIRIPATPSKSSHMKVGARTAKCETRCRLWSF